jgi:hypothetical protein
VACKKGEKNLYFTLRDETPEGETTTAAAAAAAATATATTTTTNETGSTSIKRLRVKFHHSEQLQHVTTTQEVVCGKVNWLVYSLYTN